MKKQLPIYEISDLKIPKEFEVVILKMLPEIESVEIQDVQSTMTYNPRNFESVEHFRVDILLHFKKGEEPKKLREEYSIEISNLFLYTFNEYGFVSFRVVYFNIPEYTNQDKFFELFLEKRPPILKYLYNLKKKFLKIWVKFLSLYYKLKK
jgi:hypothetical protein